MAFSLSLTTFYKPGELYAQALAAPLTTKYVRVQDGVKGYMDIFPFQSSVSFQAASCTFNANSTTSVSSVRLTVDEVSSHETLCVSDFNTYGLSLMLKPGSSDHNDEAFVNKFMEEKAKNAGLELAKMFWQGNKATGSNNLARTDGILQKLVHTSQSAYTVSATTAVTASNIIETINWAVASAPAALFTKSDVTLFMTSTNYRYYIQALQLANRYHYNDPSFSNFETMLDGYNIKIVGLPELDGNADGVDMLLTYASNFVWGTDTTDEMAGYDVWYSQDNRAIRTALECKIGAAVLEPSLVVVIK